MMTDESTSSSASSPAFSAPLAEVLPLSYAAVDVGTSGKHRVIVALLASVHLLTGAPLLLFCGFSMNGMRRNDAAALFLGPVIVSALLFIQTGITMFIRRPGCWRASVTASVINQLFALAAIITSAVIVITFRHASGMDQIGQLLGLLFGGAASVSFWLCVITVKCLDTETPRAMFGVDAMTRVRWQRLVTFIASIAYLLTALVVAAAYLFF